MYFVSDLNKMGRKSRGSKQSVTTPSEVEAMETDETEQIGAGVQKICLIWVFGPFYICLTRMFSPYMYIKHCTVYTLQ